MPRVKNPLKILHLDIETTPMKVSSFSLYPKFIPINQILEDTFTLSWAAKWEGSREVIFRKHTDKDFISLIHELLDECDAVVHYNGKKFDIKHLNREFARSGLNPPSPFSQIDLLTTVRQNFALPSYKLDYVCRYFGIGKKVKHVGIELWYDCIEGRPEAWRQMERYNKRDAVLLPKLYAFLKPWIKGHPNSGLAGDTPPNKPTCSKCGSTSVQSRGEYKTKTSVYHRYQCNGCGSWLRSRKQKEGTHDNVLAEAR